MHRATASLFVDEISRVFSIFRSGVFQLHAPHRNFKLGDGPLMSVDRASSPVIWVFQNTTYLTRPAGAASQVAASPTTSADEVDNSARSRA